MSRAKIADRKDKPLVSMFNRQGKLYLQFVVNDKKIQRSTKLADTATNRRLVQKSMIPKLEAQIINGEFLQDQDKPKTFEYYADKLLLSKENLKSYRELRNIVVNQLLPTFGNKNVKDIKRADVKRFIDLRLKEITPKRARTLLSAISAVLNIAIDYEEIVSNPALNIKLPKHDKEVTEPFSVAEVNTLLKNADGWLKNFLAFAFFTGARTGELLALRWSDVDLDNGTISIVRRLRHGDINTPKTKSSVRDIPIFEPLLPYVKEQLAIARKNKNLDVFVNPKTNKMFFGSKTLTPHWKKLLNKCEIPYKILYSTRHTFITNMLKSSEYSILDIAQMVGHSNSEMIIKNYAKYIKGEHLKLKRNFNPFTDNSADSNTGSTL